MPKFTHSPVVAFREKPPSDVSVLPTAIEKSDTLHVPSTVLLVEPHPIMRDALRLAVALRFEVFGEAATAAEAMAHCQPGLQTRPDLAILDLDLPDMTGIDATLRLVELHPDLRVMMLVNSDEETVIMESIRAGARAVVTKAEPKQVLLDALETIATGKSYLSMAASQRIVSRIRAGAGELHRATRALRPRELQVLRLMDQGKQTKEIAVVLNISLSSARTYRKSMMRKIGATCAVEALNIARKEKLLVLAGRPLSG